jgi:hypothetical protein
MFDRALSVALLLAVLGCLVIAGGAQACESARCVPARDAGAVPDLECAASAARAGAGETGCCPADGGCCTAPCCSASALTSTGAPDLTFLLLEHVLAPFPASPPTAESRSVDRPPRF